MQKSGAYQSRDGQEKPLSAVTIASGPMVIRISDRMQMQVADRLSVNGIRWLEGRGLCPDMASRYGAVSAVAGRSEWVAFPTVVAGRTVGWQFRRVGDGEPRFITTGDASKHVWNADCLTDETLADEPLIITEGRCDALAAIQSGYPRTISTPGGAVEPKPGEDRRVEYKFVDGIEPMLKHAKRIVLATDSDGPGEAMREELARRFGRGRCQFVKRPEGCKDLNDVLLGYGEAAVQECIRTAEWLHVRGLHLPLELPPRSRLRQHVSGMPGSERHYRVRRTDLAIVTGWPGCGKTTWANDFSMRMAENHGWRTVFASFEQTPQTQHMWNLRRLRLGIPPDEMTVDQIRKADEWINDHFRFVVPDEDEPTDLEFVFDMFATAVTRYGADLCVLDPWNEVEHATERDQSMTQYIADSLRRCKKFARKYDVHFMILAHPSKPVTRAGEALPEPRLDQIEDSRHWWGKADVGVVLHKRVREDGTEYTQCRMAKLKFHDEMGTPGVIPLGFNTRTYRYHEIAV